jgi:hypothetical protein
MYPCIEILLAAHLPAITRKGQIQAQAQAV